MVNLLKVIGVVFLLASGFFLGCEDSVTSSGGSTSGGTVSTDAAANQALVASFVDAGQIDVTWTNNTFSSTGNTTMDVSFDQNTKVLTVTVNIDGSVFGGADPDPETFRVDLTDFITNGTDTFSLTSATHGDISGTLTFRSDETGTFTGTATNIPSGATNATLSGTFSISGGVVTIQQDSWSFDLAGQTITGSNRFN